MKPKYFLIIYGILYITKYDFMIKKEKMYFTHLIKEIFFLF